MARFKRLTEDEARNMPRGELVVRLEREQQYWHRKLARNEIDYNDEGYATFRRIFFSMIDPAEAVSDTLAWLQGRGPGGYFDRSAADDA